jgi:hypothetical protein
VSVSAVNTFTALQTFAALNDSYNTLTYTSTMNVDYRTNSVYYINSPSASFTINFTAIPLAGQSCLITLIINTTNNFYCSTVTGTGVSTTLKYAFGPPTAPTSISAIIQEIAIIPSLSYTLTSISYFY